MTVKKTSETVVIDGLATVYKASGKPLRVNAKMVSLIKDKSLKGLSLTKPK